MDPDANLREQLEIANNWLTVGSERYDEDADRLAELVIALDGWIKGGGFLPTAWDAPTWGG